MQRYWVNQNGIQSGPLTIDELKAMTIDVKNTYVWRSGMADWQRIDEVPELSDIVAAAQAAATPVPPEPEQPAETQEQPEPSEPEAEQPSEPEEQPEQEPEAEQPEQEQPSEPEEQPHAATPPAPPAELNDEPAPAFQQPAFQQAPTPPQYASAPMMPATPVPECPPTNLVWSIVCIVLCCWIPAVIGLVFSIQVKSKYREGNYAQAKKYSDWSAWCCIISIVLGVVSMPFALLVQLLAVN